MKKKNLNQRRQWWAGLWLIIVSSGSTGSFSFSIFDEKRNTKNNANARKNSFPSFGVVQAFFSPISTTFPSRIRHHRYRCQIVSVALQSSSSGKNPNHQGTANEDDEDAATAEARRMALVRYLQQTFYKDHWTGDGNSSCHLSYNYIFEEPNRQNGGLLRHLPLWRVPWVELPGRTNVLNVFEPIYTNMFEQLLRQSSDQPCYFGHVYLMDGSQNLKKIPQADWQHCDEEMNHYKSSVLGTLMRITDYQRLSNGRLLLLVQAVERFVVTKVHQNLPYGRADVQLLPDLEHDTTMSLSSSSSSSRTDIILRNWKWKNYEYEDTKFASPELVGSVLAQVLPYAAMDTNRIPMAYHNHDGDGSRSQHNASLEPNHSDDGLEQKLIEKGILLNDENRSTTVSADELELQLWWALNDYLLLSKTPVSPILLGLLPPEVTQWADDFVLKGIADTLQDTREFRHKYTPVSPLYPKSMRQRRLSYHAAYLVFQDHQDRAELLAMSSYTMRMKAVLWKLETYYHKNHQSFQ